MLSYRTILRQAWRISWRYKFLWFFGFFASLISFTIESRILSRSLNQEIGLKSLNNLKMFLSTGIFSQDAWINLVELFKNETGAALLFLLFVLIILAAIIFFAWLATVSQIGIINSVNKIMKGKESGLNIKSGIKVGKKKFWPVFALNIAISVLINIIYLLMSYLLVLVIMENQSLSAAIYGIIFIIFIPVSLFISFITKYAIAFVVIEGKKFGTALKQGWRLFINNWLISVEVAIILFFVNLIAIILLSILSFVGFFLFFGLALSMTFVLSSGILFWLAIIIGFLIIIAILIIGGSVLNVFQISSWTDLFVQLRERGGASKLERIFTEK